MFMSSSEHGLPWPPKFFVESFHWSQSHRRRRAVTNLSKFITPSPLSFLGRHIVSQLTLHFASVVVFLAGRPSRFCWWNWLFPARRQEELGSKKILMRLYFQANFVSIQLESNLCRILCGSMALKVAFLSLKQFYVHKCSVHKYPTNWAVAPRIPKQLYILRHCVNQFVHQHVFSFSFFASTTLRQSSISKINQFFFYLFFVEASGNERLQERRWHFKPNSLSLPPKSQNLQISPGLY
jgi:hypothetical protein